MPIGLGAGETEVSSEDRAHFTETQPPSVDGSLLGQL
jgi:hypothetical protein